ncbi:23S rRNA (pseudouridine(1915)-N(3))-methyltransferase RlmH [bacterium]|nr:MAG: 23S rRNA (pseudouridine(1915)-N(3))-methyltransferase RlmH [bacterium]
MKIRVIHVGKISPLLKEAIELYEKRLSNYETLETIEVRQVKKLPQDKTVKKEGANILAILDDEETVVALTEEGRRFSSIGFAKWLADARIVGQQVSFVIGGAFGLSNDVKLRSDLALSISSMTTQHDIALLVLMEQLYRASTILRGEEYHK